MSQSRHKLDLRLAESYIPAALMLFKVLFYSFMVLFVLNISYDFHPIIFSVFLFILYVDHIHFSTYLVTFLDTTAISLDVMISIIFMLSCKQNCFFWCLVILGLWGITSISYILVINVNLIKHDMHCKIVHIVTFTYFISFVSLLCSKYNGEMTSFFFFNNSSQSCHFFLRNILYSVLILCDSYSIRPHFQLETDRYFMCKYGSVLFAPWQFAVILFGCFIISLIIVIFQLRNEDTEIKEKNQQNIHDVTLNFNDNNILLKGSHLIPIINVDMQDSISKVLPSADDVNIADLDVMEAFRMAKQQYSSNHGGKMN
jgi:hypothetical protein